MQIEKETDRDGEAESEGQIETRDRNQAERQIYKDIYRPRDRSQRQTDETKIRDIETDKRPRDMDRWKQGDRVTGRQGGSES